jgi:hypothetical protein
VQSTYDPETETLDLTLPVGWTDTMSQADRDTRAAEWCIDDPTYDVQYELQVATYSDAQATVAMYETTEKMQVSEREHGFLEFCTTNCFKPLANVHAGVTVCLVLRAVVSMAKGAPKKINLVEGRFVSQEKLAVLGESSAGLFFIAAGGFAIFAHYGTTACVTHIALVGKVENVLEDSA